MSEVDLGHVANSRVARADSRSPTMGSGDGENGMTGGGGVTAKEVPQEWTMSWYCTPLDCAYLSVSHDLTSTLAKKDHP